MLFAYADTDNFLKIIMNAGVCYQIHKYHLSDRFTNTFSSKYNFSHIRPLGAAGALAVDICICFHDIESCIFAKLFPSLAV